MFKFYSSCVLVGIIISAGAFSAVPQKPLQKASCTLYGSKDSDEVPIQTAFSTGTLVEFSSKNNKLHVGKIVNVEHKSNGGARYDVLDYDGSKSNIADKAVNFALPISPNDERRVTQLFDEFAAVLDEPEKKLFKDLDMNVELLEMAWGEALEDDSHELTASSLIELIHSHTASAMETYKAWKLLRSDLAHIFFKEIKDHGRVVSFKAKAEKAVEAAKETFCRKPEHSEHDVCWV